mmetsp:Transcript_11801/g.12960  ORF Transcript_11801/g.12960 Transcript_11801/m.12960 type:complete len:87 (+) Transcript_11801:21-281(+)
MGLLRLELWDMRTGTKCQPYQFQSEQKVLELITRMNQDFGDLEHYGLLIGRKVYDPTIDDHTLESCKPINNKITVKIMNRMLGGKP